ncbi:MAG: PQQ-binding-like beta-propeller repeat protein [Pseudonocardiaceae bacterium]
MTTATGPPPRAGDATHRDAPECPYVGLVPFTEENAAYFFGRQRESDLIVANLTASRLTVLYAPSGVGKTSVLRAGVLPALRHSDDDGDDDLGVFGAAVVYVSSWHDASRESIAAEVSAEVSRVTGAGAGAHDTGAPPLSVSWLREVLRQSRVSAVYLILDQFEEYFRYHPRDLGEEGLTAELGRILSTRDLPVHVLLAIREDALADLDRFKGRVPQLFRNLFRLAHLSRDEARAAIKGPLDRYNLLAPPDRTMSIDPGLITALLDQVRTGQVQVAPEGTAPNGVAPDASDPGDIETPFLQLVLTRLWNQERATGSSALRKSTLDELGGAQTIVQSHLDNVMAGLSPAQVDVAAAVFRHLITTAGTKIALSAEDLAELVTLPVEAVRDLLETLCSGLQRILRPVSPAVGVAGGTRYEIFHDVMGAAVLDWRRRQERAETSRQLIAEREEARAAARAARRTLHRTQLTVGLAVILLLVSVVFVLVGRSEAQQREYLRDAATALGYNPVQSLQRAVKAHGIWWIGDNKDTRSAVLIAASSPRGQVVAGPDPMMIGMRTTPDSRHVVVYDAHGSIQVIDDKGHLEHETKATGLPGGITPSGWASAVSPDASRVALGTDHGTVVVINTTTGQHINIESKECPPRTTTNERDLIPTTVAWSGSAADGLVLVVSKSRSAATYDPLTGKQVACFPGAIYDAAPLADGQHIGTSGDDKKLRVWDARTGAQIAESSTLDLPVFALKRYGQSVVGLSTDPMSGKISIVVWNGQAGSNPVRYPIEGLAEFRQFAVNKEAQTVTIAGDKEAQTYSLVDGSRKGSLPPQADFITNMATSPDGQWITTTSADGRVLVWPVRQRSPTAPTYELLAHSGEVTQVKVSYLREGAVVMSLGIDGTVRRWELPPVTPFTEHDNRVTTMDLSRDGSWLVTASQDGRAFIIDPRDLTKPLASLPVNKPLQAVLFDPTEPHRIITLGRLERVPMLWSWGGDGPPQLLPLEYEQPSLPTSGYRVVDGYLASLAISPDGKTVAAGDTGGTVHLWDARTGKLLRDARTEKLRTLPGSGQPANSVAFDPAGQLLAATDRDGVRLWRWDTPEPPTRLKHPGATSVTFDPSGQHLVSTVADGTVKIWTADGKPVGDELIAHGRLSSGPSFSQDGRLLAVGTTAGLVEVWEVSSGVTVMLDRHHSASVNKVVFLPGSNPRLISASDDTTVAEFTCPACTDQDKVIQQAEDYLKQVPQ